MEIPVQLGQREGPDNEEILVPWEVLAHRATPEMLVILEIPAPKAMQVLLVLQDQLVILATLANEVARVPLG